MLSQWGETQETVKQLEERLAEVREALVTQMRQFKSLDLECIDRQASLAAAVARREHWKSQHAAAALDFNGDVDRALEREERQAADEVRSTNDYLSLVHAQIDTLSSLRAELEARHQEERQNLQHESTFLAHCGKTVERQNSSRTRRQHLLRGASGSRQQSRAVELSLPLRTQ